MEKLVHVSFRCDVKLERRLRVEAAKQDMNRTEFIVEALIEKLERLDGVKSYKTELAPNNKTVFI